jgi:hypothetical protein
VHQIKGSLAYARTGLVNAPSAELAQVDLGSDADGGQVLPGEGVLDLAEADARVNG